MKPKLYILSGLPASGKSTLAKLLAQKLKAVYIRVDTIEQGLRDLCSYKVSSEGYRLAYRIVSDNLRMGSDVIADSCNPWELTRNEWNTVAQQADSDFQNIEIICSAADEHLQRVRQRQSEIPGLRLPTWEEIQNREYHPWDRNARIQIDTSGKSIDHSLNELWESLTNL